MSYFNKMCNDNNTIQAHTSKVDIKEQHNGHEAAGSLMSEPGCLTNFMCMLL